MLRKVLVSSILFFNIFFGISLLVPSVAHAHVDATCDKSSSFLGIPTWYKYLHVHVEDGSCDVVVPTDSEGNTDIAKVVGPVLLAVFEIILRISGAVAVCIVIYGGVQYILSQGEPEKTKGAKGTILNAFIGLAVVISATVVVNLIGNSLLK